MKETLTSTHALYTVCEVSSGPSGVTDRGKQGSKEASSYRVLMLSQGEEGDTTPVSLIKKRKTKIQEILGKIRNLK